jgi:hypothetical protein
MVGELRMNRCLAPIAAVGVWLAADMTTVLVVPAACHVVA